MAVVTRGERELSQRFETFPTRLRQRLVERITGLTERLESRIQSAEPYRTGKLRSETTSRIFQDNPERVAGYVQIFAPGNANEYAKAATLEYGTDKARRIPDQGGIYRRMGRGQKRIQSRLTKPAHITAFRYLRDPLEQIRPEFEAEIAAALNQTVEEGS